MQLFDYQKKAVEFIHEKKKIYLCLDMGLGKTLTSLHASIEKSDLILVVAEKNEIVNNKNFQKEVGLWFSDCEYINLREEMPELSSIKKTTVFGINPEGIDKMPNWVHKKLKALIVDEATVAKSHNSKRFKKIHKLAKEAEYVILLSGTPIMNGASELYAPLMLLDNPMVAGKKVEARYAFETIFAGGHKKRVRNTGRPYLDYAWIAKGAENLRELRYLVRDSFFVMSKEVTGIFKKKNRSMKKVTMSLEWIAEYNQAWSEYLVQAKKRKLNIKNITDLRGLIENGKCYQVNSKWKGKQIVEDIKNKVYGNDRIVVFTLYAETFELIKAELEKSSISYGTFEDVSVWKKSDAQVIVGMLIANGKGTNLPEANVCLMADMSFVPAQNLQAENRVDRPEQTKEMNIIYYITEGEEIVDWHVRNINFDKMKKIQEFMRPLTLEEIMDMPERIETLKIKYPEECKILGI